jgi:hypothetical protein
MGRIFNLERVQKERHFSLIKPKHRERFELAPDAGN